MRAEKSIPNNTIVVGVERKLYIGFKESMFRIWYTTVTNYVSCGIGGWDTYTIEHY
jgi:hypothetical protein